MKRGRQVNSRLIIGLMSGTSADGIDAALVRVTKKAPGKYTAKVLHHLEFPWGHELRRRLLTVMAPAKTTTQEICELNVAAAEGFARAVMELMRRTGHTTRQISAIGSHGQTICHLPPGQISKGTYPSTLQIGDPSVIATLTGIATVGNFRPADIAAGGQGAPLVPFADDLLLSHRTKIRAVQNIGGIANVTYLPPTADRRRQVIAFDTGPGNMVMDAVICAATKGKLAFDRNGRLAAAGSLDTLLFRRLQAHPYFTRKPPKSTGREDFGATFARTLRTRSGKIEDLLHTLCRWTAWSIADAYINFLPELPDEVILCGGGADNPLLVQMLGEELATLRSEFPRPKPPRIRRIDKFGIPNKAKEAASFAILAAATLDGMPGNLPSVTGASRGEILGVIAPRNHKTPPRR